MKLTILLLILALNLFGQEIKTINLDSVEYYVYPEYQGQKWIRSYNFNKNKKCRLKDGKWLILYEEDTTKIYSKFELDNCTYKGELMKFHFNGKYLKNLFMRMEK
jgi:hypothetical protein